MEHISKPVKRVSEAVVLKRVMIEASRLSLRVFRNHVGGFWTKSGEFQRTGLCKGSSDLIGWNDRGQFVAIEVKSKTGKLSKEQENFIFRVNEAGGIGLVCRDAKDLKKLLDEHKNNMQ